MKKIKTHLIIFFLLTSILSQGQEKLVKVNGRNFNIYVKGLEKRKPNAPVIIFENGMGVGLGNWDTVIDKIAEFAPVFAYDRAGVEKSETTFQLPTLEVVAKNLKAILTQLNIKPPYILVGHSMGGLYTRGFAGIYPDDIAALVFIDPADFTESKEEWNSNLQVHWRPGKKN